MKIWTIIWICEWEGGVSSVHTTEEAMLAQVKEDAGVSVDGYNDSAKRPADDAPLDDWVSFIYDEGWKVQHYIVEAHEIEVPA